MACNGLHAGDISKTHTHDDRKGGSDMKTVLIADGEKL